MSNKSITINLEAHPIVGEWLNGQDTNQSYLDLPRYYGAKFVFNGGKPTLLPEFKTHTQNHTRKRSHIGNKEYVNKDVYFQFVKFIRERGNGITPQGRAWNRFFAGMSQGGFFRMTEVAVKAAAIENMGMSMVRSKSEKGNQETINEIIHGMKRIPFTPHQTYYIDESRDACDLPIITVREEIRVEDPVNKNDCARFSTTCSISGNEIKYHFTKMNVLTATGRKLFPDTRSILNKIIELYERLVASLTGKGTDNIVSTCTLYQAKHLKEKNSKTSAEPTQETTNSEMPPAEPQVKTPRVYTGLFYSAASGSKKAAEAKTLTVDYSSGLIC